MKVEKEPPGRHPELGRPLSCRRYAQNDPSSFFLDLVKHMRSLGETHMDTVLWEQLGVTAAGPSN